MDHPYSALLWFDKPTGNVWIIELPNQPHETASEAISLQLAPVVLAGHLKPCHSTRWVGADLVGREADVSFRPTVANPPVGITPQECVTFVVEVGWAQKWAGARGLIAKANDWFAQHPSVENVLLIHISHKLKKLQAKLYDRNADAGCNPVQQIDFSNGHSHSIMLDTRRLLTLPAGAVLPAGLAANTIIDLVLVRTLVRQ